MNANTALKSPQGLFTSAPDNKSKNQVGICPFSELTPKTQEESMRRRAYVDALCAQPSRSYTKYKMDALIQKIADRIGDNHPPSCTTLYRWHRRFISQQNKPIALVPRFNRRGGKGQRINSDLLAIIEEQTVKKYLTLQRNSIKVLHDTIMLKVEEFNNANSTKTLLKTPSYETIRRYIRLRPKYDVDLARYGREYVRKKYRHSSITPATLYLLERVEIDHTPLNLFVVDEVSLLVLGRPYITWIIDCHTRMILGFYLSFSPPSIEAVLRCLKHAITNKSYVKERYPDIQHDWPCYGIPATAVVDNGLEFHAQDLLRATFELGINYQFCPPRTPWFKPMVERSLRTLAEQFAHLLPGTSFANWFDRYGYDPLKEGVVTLTELVHALHIWIIDIYAQTYHRGLKQTPYAAWQKSAELVTPKAMPAEELSLVLSKQTDRVLGHAGIELHGLRYNCKELHPLRKQLGDRLKVQVRYDPDDLGFIHVLHPITKEAIATPCLTPDYANGLHLYQHTLIQKALRTQGLKTSDPLALAKSKAHMQDVVGNMVRSRKLADRKRAARITGNHSVKAQELRPLAASVSENACRPLDEAFSIPSALPILTSYDEEADYE